MKLQEFSLLLMGIICLIILYSFVGNLLEHKKLHFIHETGFGIIVGLCFGLVLYFLVGLEELQFNEEIFFYGLLPPMIFAGGYNLKKKDFGKNVVYILAYGALGTLVSFGVTFGLTMAINKLDWIVPLRGTSLQPLETGLIVKYSATISATDSVAALTMIKATQFPKLFSIIFGEGMVNDAVAIILYNVVGGLFDQLHSDMAAEEIVKTILGSFLGIIFISVFIGLVSAILCSFLFKNCRFLVENEVTQVAFTYIFGIMSYIIAQFCGMSGVITVLISGVTLAHYNFYNLTVGGMHATTITFQSISFIAEAIVFIYLGVSTVYYFINEVLSLSFLALQLLVCVISRLTAIFGLAAIFKRLMRKKWTITNRELSIVSVAGTIRGSVAFALILTIQPHSDRSDANEVSLIKSTTLGLVCFTTIVLGALMPLFIKLILGDGQHAPSEPKAKVPEQERTLLAQSEQRQMQKEEAVEQPGKKTKKAGFFKYSDENFWRPYLIYNYEERKEEFKLYKRVMKFNSRGEYQGGNFYLLGLIKADPKTLEEFVKMQEEAGTHHQPPPQQHTARLQKQANLEDGQDTI